MSLPDLLADVWDEGHADGLQLPQDFLALDVLGDGPFPEQVANLVDGLGKLQDGHFVGIADVDR